MKRKFNIVILSLAVIGMISSCKSDFLDVKPAGSLDANLLANQKGLDAILVGTYSMLPGTKASIGLAATSSNWIWGSIRGMEANKGSDAGDITDIAQVEQYSELPTNGYVNDTWRGAYEGVSRCNNLIVVANKALENKTITQEQADLYIKQARVLRGWYHYGAWQKWEKIPYLDEKTDVAAVKNDADVTDKIIADLTEGTSLPLNMGQIGKWNKTVSQMALAQALMSMKRDYAGAKTLLLDAKATGVKPNGAPIGFATTYGEIFDTPNRNGIESVYTVQYSVNDGSGGINGGNGELLNFPYKSGASPSGCCGFFQPTQDFVNSFRTKDGLPLLDDSYDTPANAVKSDIGLTPVQAFVPDAGPLDPRLDWSVGRRGIPYWDWGFHTGSDWIRDPSYAGPYSPKKQVYKKSQQGQYTEVGGWSGGWTANGYRMMRYSDLRLLLAECQIQTGDLPGAFANINDVRNRAANPAGFVKLPDGSNAANYQISLYPSATAFPFDTKDNALKALYMERKLELGQEGHRMFDLNRWGNAVTEINRALTYEKSMPWGPSAYGGKSFAAVNTTIPIPQRQIDLSNGNLVQNR